MNRQELPLNENSVVKKNMIRKKTKPRLRDPVGKAFSSFVLPLRGNPAVEKHFRDRKVNLISRKDLRNLGRGRVEDKFVGTLRVF